MKRINKLLSLSVSSLFVRFERSVLLYGLR